MADKKWGMPEDKWRQLIFDHEEQYLREGKITVYEYLSLKRQDQILKSLHEIIKRLDGLQILVKYRR